MPSCSVRDEERLVQHFTNTSILMFGDSTSARLLQHVCDAYRSKARSFIMRTSSAKKYSHRLSSLDNHYCSLPGERGTITLGSFSHYGATGPPYWAFAYPLAPWLAETTLGQVAQDVPKFRAHTAQSADPTVILAGSGFWDLAAKPRGQARHHEVRRPLPG